MDPNMMPDMGSIMENVNRTIAQAMRQVDQAMQQVSAATNPQAAQPQPAPPSPQEHHQAPRADTPIPSPQYHPQERHQAPPAYTPPAPQQPYEAPQAYPQAYAPPPQQYHQPQAEANAARPQRYHPQHAEEYFDPSSLESDASLPPPQNEHQAPPEYSRDDYTSSASTASEPRPVEHIVPLYQKLKVFWANDPNQKLTFVCQGSHIEALKPFIGAASPVFKAMMEAEGGNPNIEINDFPAKVVEKMVEFAETNKIGNFDGCEEDLFKIGHKYEIEDLKKVAAYQLIKTTTSENAFDRLKLAMLHDLKDLVVACSNYLRHGF